MAIPSLLLDRASDEPVYGQIARQIRGAIASGALAPGTPLPPVRGLASDLGVNLNTVARAYRLLEDEGFVVLRDRSGAEVAPPARRASPETRETLLEELRVVLARLRQAGVGVPDLERIAVREIALLARDASGGR